MNTYRLRTMTPRDWPAVAELIRSSTNTWYEAHARPPIFTGDPSATRLFCEVYESLDPDCCLLAETSNSGALAGSCFYHPRPRHVSLGIMNVHPEHFGRGVARQLLNAVLSIAENRALPTRLVSSAMNLDSFSLYTRAGFVPGMAFQDMLLHVPSDGLPPLDLPGLDRVRPATPEDLESIVRLEADLQSLDRRQDYEFFLGNEMGIWQTAVLPSATGPGLEGVLVSVDHPGSRMLGPGVMRTEAVAAALIRYQLDSTFRGKCPVWLVPVDCPRLVAELYRWGARNCELHFSQVLGNWTPPTGIVMPTFMPETG